MKSSAAHGNEARPLARLLRERRPVVLDGAMGTEIEHRGIPTRLPLWSAHALEISPAIVAQIHTDSILAGAEIITADTFRTTPRTFARAGLPDRSGELTARAVALALEARRGTAVLVAGSMAPLEDCYHPELVPPETALRTEHGVHARRLAGAGVDVLLVETMGTIREACAAAEAAAGTGLEYALSFICRPDGALYGGESLTDAVRAVSHYAPAAYAINCVSPRSIAGAFALLRRAAGGLPVGLYANVGMPGEERGMTIVEDISPARYGEYARAWAEEGAALIGGCCGTTPEHIRAVSRALGKTGKPSAGGRHAT